MPAGLRVGLVGANPDRGWARDAHLPALRALPEFSIQAVSARTQEIADAAKASFGAATASADSLALARDPDVDIVSVCVKVPEHRAVVLAALEAGKHVYCEWPLGRDTAEAELMTQAAAATGQHVMIGLQGAACPAAQAAGLLVRQGRVGALRSLNMVSPTGGWGGEMPDHYAYLQDRSNGATLLSIPGGHSMALIEAVAGRYLDVVATGSNLAPEVRLGGGETLTRTGFDHLVVVGRHEGGCVSTLEVVGGVLDVPFRFDVRGSAGTIGIAGGSPGGYQAGVLTLVGADLPQPRARGAAANVAELYARFAADIQAGTRSVPDFAAAVRVHRLLDAVDQAAATGRRITVEG